MYLSMGAEVEGRVNKMIDFVLLIQEKERVPARGGIAFHASLGAVYPYER